MDDRARAWMEAVQAGPPKWFGAASWALMGLIGLAFGLIVMEQWVVLFILTRMIWSPWSVILGIAIAAAQIQLFLGKKQEKQACEI